MSGKQLGDTRTLSTDDNIHNVYQQRLIFAGTVAVLAQGDNIQKESTLDLGNQQRLTNAGKQHDGKVFTVEMHQQRVDRESCDLARSQASRGQDDAGSAGYGGALSRPPGAGPKGEVPWARSRSDPGPPPPVAGGPPPFGGGGDLGIVTLTDAGTVSGMNAHRIIKEAIAAAIAYGLDKEGSSDRIILIYGMGGGTFVVSLLTREDKIFEVKATENCGQDLAGNQRDKGGRHPSLPSPSGYVAPLRKEIVDLVVDRIRTSSETMRVEELNMGYLRNSMGPVAECLRDSGIDKRNVHTVVLVGESARILKVQSMIQDFFKGKEPNRLINPDEAVANGAAVQAAFHTGNGSSQAPDVLLPDVTPLPMGLETAGGIMTKLSEHTTVHERDGQLLIIADTLEELKVFTRKFVKKYCHMAKLGIKPNTVHYNALIGACEKVENLTQAMQLYADMRRQGTKLPIAMPKVQSMIRELFKVKGGPGRCLRGSGIDKWNVHRTCSLQSGTYTRTCSLEGRCTFPRCSR